MHRRAFTLIEVLAATVLAASLLAVLLVARQRHAAQVRHAQDTLRATYELDQLVERWWASEAGVPRNPRHPRKSEGLLGDGLRWRTEIVADAMADDLALDCVEVRVLDDADRVAAQVTLYVKADSSASEGGDSHAP